MFKIFYSWQSDLAGNKTRNFIRECIDEAIDLAQETEAIEAIRDEATSGTTGSPNIVTTLFSKIDDCDLFIADLSLCFSSDGAKEKHSPNPNVLLELGYAVKTLGWERVICLCNTDFGSQYPFDIAHNRISGFSLNGKSRKEVKSDISRIIFINIRDLKQQPPRTKNGMANHIIGTYDYINHQIKNGLSVLNIESQEGYKLHNEELLNDCRKLIYAIQELNVQTALTDQLEIQTSKKETEESAPLSEFNKTLNGKVLSVTWDNVESDKALIKELLDIDVSEEFFCLGNLKKITRFLSEEILDGTDNEKEKYNKLHELSYKLLLLDIRIKYLKTFDKMCFIPLAIQNISSVNDTDIKVVVSVKTGDVVDPDKSLICSDLDGLQGELCRNDEEDDVGIICELFCLNEDERIRVEEAPYDATRFIPKVPILTSRGFTLPDKTAEDYEQELKDYIECDDYNRNYEFNVASLRPGECKWLCRGMLIKPVENNVQIHYQIYSTYSDGTINGDLQLEV